MFGKTKDLIDGDLTGIFGDEEAADNEAQLAQLRSRIDDVEGQISSQFTSMAAYAQIAQEQIELARAESKASAERTESRLTQLIERERSERMGMPTPGATVPAPSADVDRRLDALEASVEAIKVGISDCLVRQKALADAITALFRNGESTEPAISEPPTTPAVATDQPHPVADQPVIHMSPTNDTVAPPAAEEPPIAEQPAAEAPASAPAPAPAMLQSNAQVEPISVTQTSHPFGSLSLG